MKSFRIYTILLVSISAVSLLGQQTIFDVIPKVNPVFSAGKEFVAKDTLYVYHQQKNKENGDYLKFLIQKYFNNHFTVIQGEFRSYLDDEMPVKMNALKSPRVMLHLDEERKDSEFYHLEVEEGAIAIEGGEIGLKRGMNTLMQLLSTENYIHQFSPVEIMMNPYNIIRAKRAIGEDIDTNLFKKIPYTLSLQPMIIQDEPKFPHRGMLLDCARHFFSVETVKKYLDLMALYKMNVLHWHLTEDQGWRIQIDKYPKLTEVGAWRTEEDGSKYGGFYTKEEIRDIVKYANQRGITVIPEIELPGHSQAAVASYPWLSCTGEQYEVVNDWGVFKEIYCAGNDSVFVFLEDVLTEVMELFPSKYIHIGGDEAPKFRWEHCIKCQKRIKNKELKDEHELQAYFIKRIEKFLQENGRQLIGWDEILEGGVSKTATVQSWRGFDGGIEAAKHGNKVVMSPTSHCYFDYDLKSIDLKKVWEFDPIPEGLEEAYHQNILGGECNLWSERIPDEANLDSKVFPRLLAMAEVLWSGNKQGGFDEFHDRVQKHYPLLEFLEVKYGMEAIPLEIISTLEEGKVYLTAKPKLKNIEVQFKWADSESWFPENKSIELTKSGKIQAIATRNGKVYGDTITQFFQYHKAIGAKVKYNSKYSKWYTGGGDSALVDGRAGSLDFRDGNWQGFWGEDVYVELDLSSVKEFSTVDIMYFVYQNSWIFPPKSLLVESSIDGKEWKKFKESDIRAVGPRAGKHIIKKSVFGYVKPVKVRYLRIKLKNSGKVPEWHEAAGQDSWLFIDEIIVE